ncbi:transposase [Thermodesulfobacteriota bacterium]
MGRIRLHVTLACSAYSLKTFILDNVEPGSVIATDSWKSYNFIEGDQCAHEKSNQSRSKDNESLYGARNRTVILLQVRELNYAYILPQQQTG